MPDVLYFGDNSDRGCYFFHAPQKNGWVVANLETERCWLVDKPVKLEVRDEAESFLCATSRGSRAVMAESKVGGRHAVLVRDHDAIALVRDYPDDVEVVVVYDPDGSVYAGARADRVIRFVAGAVGRAGRKARDDENKGR